MEVKFYGVPEANSFPKYNDMHYVLEHIKSLESEFEKCSIYHTENEEIIFQPFENGKVFYINAIDSNDNTRYTQSKLIIKDEEIDYIISNISPRSSEYDMMLLQTKVIKDNNNEEMRLFSELGERINVDSFAVNTTSDDSLYVKFNIFIKRAKEKSIYQKQINSSMASLGKALEQYPTHQSIIEKQNEKEEVKEKSVNTSQQSNPIMLTEKQAQYLNTVLKVISGELDKSVLDKEHEIQSLDQRLEEIPLHYQMVLIDMSNGKISPQEAREKMYKFYEDESSRKQYTWTEEQKVIDLNNQKHINPFIFQDNSKQDFYNDNFNINEQNKIR